MPILVPVVIAAGVDPVNFGINFGIIVVMILVIGALTPPLGVLVFTTAHVGGADQAAIFRAVILFTIVLIGVLLLVSDIPH